MNLLRPTIVTDGGPWAEHDYPCPVHLDEPAVLHLDTGIFHPSWKADKEGWMLIRVKSKFKRKIIKMLIGEDA